MFYAQIEDVPFNVPTSSVNRIKQEK